MDSITKSSSFDVAIIGAGLAGLSLAYFLAKAGLKVGVYERRKIGAGASGGVVGALAPHMPENWNAKKQYQFEAFTLAPEFWKDIEALAECSTGYQRLNRLQRIEDASMREKALMRHEAAKKSWCGLGEWLVLDDNRHPFIDAPLGYICDTMSGKIHPRLAILALSRAIRRLGAEIFEETNVDEPKSLRAEKIVIAAGFESWPWLRRYFGPSFGEGIKGQAAVLKPKTPWHYPMVTGDGFYIVPHNELELAIGSTSERYWQHQDIDSSLAELIEKVSQLCPELRFAECVYTWSGIRPRAYRPDPLIGEVEPNLFVSCGGFKTGFGFAPKVSLDLSRIIRGEKVELPRGFSPN